MDLNTWRAQIDGMKQFLRYAFYINSEEFIFIKLYSQNKKISLKARNHDKKYMWNVLGRDLCTVHLLS